MVPIASQRSAALTMLVERLRWPVKMVRWRAADAIKGLLEAPEASGAATDCLLAWIAGRRLESEVLSGLSVLVVTNTDSRPDFDLVVRNISCPSLASDFLLHQMYGRFTELWRPAHSGTAPDDFVVEPYFTEHKAAQVPGGLGQDLQWLEERTGTPMLRQWAYEWSSLRSALGAGYTRYPNYFGEFGLQRQNIIGQFIQRQGEIYRSAFQRTLACAVSEWGLDARTIAPFSMFGVPCLPDLFALTPTSRPGWLPAVDAVLLGDPLNLPEVIRSILDRQPHGEDQIVSLRIPVDRSLGEFGELEISAFLLDEEFELADGQSLDTRWNFYGLARYEFRGIRERLDPQPQSGKRGSAISVCCEEHPQPHGYWHDDYYHVGLRLPASYCFDRPTFRRVDSREATVSIGGETVGSTSFWLDRWTPMYAPNSPTRCGSATFIKKRRLEAKATQLGRTIGWFGRLSRMQKPTPYGDLEPTETTCLLR